MAQSTSARIQAALAQQSVVEQVRLIVPDEWVQAIRIGPLPIQFRRRSR